MLVKDQAHMQHYDNDNNGTICNGAMLLSTIHLSHSLPNKNNHEDDAALEDEHVNVLSEHFNNIHSHGAAKHTNTLQDNNVINNATNAIASFKHDTNTNYDYEIIHPSSSSAQKKKMHCNHHKHHRHRHL